jgi:hypothetical protein
MSDWQVGDLAACIKKDAWRTFPTGRPAEGPAYDTVHRVRRVGIFPLDGKAVLWLEAWPGDNFRNSFTAARFRKIRPDEREACEPEFVTLLQRIKRKEVA